MADDNGMDRLNQRMARGQRAIPPSRRPAPPAPSSASSEEAAPARKAAAPVERVEPADAALVDGPAVSLAPTGTEKDVPAPGAHEMPMSPQSTPSAIVHPSPISGASLSKTERPGGSSLRLKSGEPQANLAVRVRRSLDLRLDDLLHDLRHRELRSSKAELVEMLLWELPSVVTVDLEDRLDRFRHAGGRR